MASMKCRFFPRVFTGRNRERLPVSLGPECARFNVG
jgi:hypothetical protein